jgi:hypothetical protein
MTTTNSPANLELEWADLTLEPTNGIVQSPTWDDVRAIVEHLALGEPGGFVILRAGTSDYIQAAMIDEGLIVEHHTPKPDEHFILADGPLLIVGDDGARERGEGDQLHDAIALFRCWFDPGTRATITDAAEWERMTL